MYQFSVVNYSGRCGTVPVRRKDRLNTPLEVLAWRQAESSCALEPPLGSGGNFLPNAELSGTPVARRTFGQKCQPLSHEESVCVVVCNCSRVRRVSNSDTSTFTDYWLSIDWWLGDENRASIQSLYCDGKLRIVTILAATLHVSMTSTGCFDVQNQQTTDHLLIVDEKRDLTGHRDQLCGSLCSDNSLLQPNNGRNASQSEWDLHSTGFQLRTVHDKHCRCVWQSRIQRNPQPCSAKSA